MKFRKFNLKEAIAYPERVVTRGGKRIKHIHCFEDVAVPQCVVVVDADGYFFHYTREGTYFANGSDSSHDLFLVQETKPLWINLFSTSDGRFFTTANLSEEDALKESGVNTFVKTIETNIDIPSK